MNIVHDHDHQTRDHRLHFAPARLNFIFAFGVGLNLAIVILQAGYGLVAHSTALLADAGHNASDVLSLIMAWVASYLCQTAPTKRHTYGLRGSSILASLANAILLLVTIQLETGDAPCRQESHQTV